MKNFVKGSLAVAVALTALAATSNAQNVQMNGLGSSALFLELGLAASTPAGLGGTGGLGATCVWSTATSNVVVATDSSQASTIGSKTDSGNAFVAWTPTSGSCTSITSSTQVYAYLQTDSVVGNRCLFNGCTIAYPTNVPAPAGQILAVASEVALPAAIATALNNAAVNAAGTDIRPEDAAFAIARALKPCGTAVVTGSQYLGLGYVNGDSIASAVSGSPFNVVNFSLPTSYTVTPVGATPIVVVVNGNGGTNGFSNPAITNISSADLAKFLDGTSSFTSQVLSSSDVSGSPATVFVREPLSGTYNTMEYNVPNTVTLQTSQDVGVNQISTQRNCNGTAALNPMNITTASGGVRKRAIGTGQELSTVAATQNSLGYGFWSVANFKAFTAAAAPNAKYLTVDGVEPLLKATAAHTGVIPTTGTSDLANVDLSNVANGTYPIWSLLRLVNIGATATTGVTNMARAAQNFVPTGSSTSRPDFVKTSSLTVVRSHFLPPVGAGEPAAAAIANGHVGNISNSACTAPEAGGDVGGQVSTLAADSTFCQNNNVTTGHTGLRR